MIETSLDNFGDKIKAKRGSMGLRGAAKKIGVSPATLSRIERGNLPDLINFRKLCIWLRVNPGDVLLEGRAFIPIAKFTKEDYAFMYECIERTIQLARSRK